MKIKLRYLIVIAAMILFILIPVHSSDVFLRLYFSDVHPSINPNPFYLYYATDTADFNEQQMLKGIYDEEHNRVTFQIDSSLAEHITGLRIDFPSENQVAVIRAVSVNSAGIVKRQYNPCTFFADGNILAAHGISARDLVVIRALAFIGTTPDDPYLVLSEGLSKEIVQYSGHFVLTRILICLFIGVCFLSYKKKLFKG